MNEILENQQLEINNLLSFRGMVKQSELGKIPVVMKDYVENQGAKCIGSPIIATFQVTSDGKSALYDIEVLIPVDKVISGGSTYIFKNKIKIVNAIMVRHIGDPNTLQQACDKLNEYIIIKKYQPLTVGYNVTKKLGITNDIEIDVYVGVNPNIL